MNWFNPLRCTTESTRRLSVVLLIFALLSWVIWVGVASDGFSGMHPAGWLVFVGVPIAAYIALLAVSPYLRKASKEVRLLFSANIMWAFLIGAWGYVWGWENEFSFDRYLGLFLLPAIGTWLGFLLWKWSRSAPSATTIDRKEISEKQQQESVTNDIDHDKKESVQPKNEKWYKSPYLAIGIPIIVLGVIFRPNRAYETFISTLVQIIGLAVIVGVFYGIKWVIDKTKESKGPDSN